jgi:hypothetical protein
MPPGLDTARHTDPSRIRHHRVNPELTPEVPLDTPITPSPVDDDPLYSAEELASMRWLMQEKAEAFSELSRRIARLCHRLGIQLKTEEDLRRILAREAEGFSEADRALAEFSSMGLGGHHPSREHLEREELRGLLAMRCELLTHTLQDWGLEATQTITAMSESELELEGFAPGSDGFTLLRQLNAPREPRQIS